MKNINKDYFQYLIKQHKRLLFLIWLIGFILIPFFAFINSTADTWIAARTLSIITLIYGFIISFLAPIYLFSFLQKKKSTIVYFSLPIKKQSLFITTALFSLFATIIPVVINYIIALLLTNYKYSYTEINYILSFSIIIIYMIGQQAITATITMLCQNTLDSFVANAAYVITPLTVFFCLDSYLSNLADKIMVGNGNYTAAFSKILHYICLPYSGLYELNYASSNNPNASKILVIYWLVITVVFIFTAYQLFLKRTIEQSENHTKSIFIYPVLITAITFSFMLVTYDSTYDADRLMIYGFIFILYLIMYFFSVRKVYFTWKIPAVFIIFFICCVGFANIFNDTRGFGILSEYPNIENQTSFSFYAESSKKLTYNNEEINHFYLNSKNKNTISLIYDFQKDLINEKIITPMKEYYSTEYDDLADEILIQMYYFNNNDTTSRNYVITSKQNFDKFIEMYDEFLKTVETNNEYTCHHDEYLDDNQFTNDNIEN